MTPEEANAFLDRLNGRVGALTADLGVEAIDPVIVKVVATAVLEQMRAERLLPHAYLRRSFSRKLVDP